jgi:hypothetical protein
MTADRRKEPEADEQYTTHRGPIEEEFDDDTGGNETARDVAGGIGVGAGLLVAIGFALFMVVLLGYVIVNAL